MVRISWILPYLVVGTLASAIGPFAGSVIEARFFPIIADSVVSNIQFRNNSLCWGWSWRKIRRAQPVAFNFTIQAGLTTVDVPIPVYRATGALVSAIERPPGNHREEFCAPLLASVPIGTPMLVKGVGVYRTHDLWLVPQELPTVRAN